MCVQCLFQLFESEFLNSLRPTAYTVRINSILVIKFFLCRWRGEDSCSATNKQIKTSKCVKTDWIFVENSWWSVWLQLTLPSIYRTWQLKSKTPQWLSRDQHVNLSDFFFFLAWSNSLEPWSSVLFIYNNCHTAAAVSCVLNGFGQRCGFCILFNPSKTSQNITAVQQGVIG